MHGGERGGRVKTVRRPFSPRGLANPCLHFWPHKVGGIGIFGFAVLAIF